MWCRSNKLPFAVSMRALGKFSKTSHDIICSEEITVVVFKPSLANPFSLWRDLSFLLGKGQSDVSRIFGSEQNKECVSLHWIKIFHGRITVMLFLRTKPINSNISLLFLCLLNLFLCSKIAHREQPTITKITSTMDRCSIWTFEGWV